MFWPVGLILAGILIILKQRVFAFLLVMFCVVFGLVSNVYVFDDNSLEDSILINEKKELSNESVSKIVYELNFGAGELNLYSGFDYESYNLDLTTFYPDRKVDIRFDVRNNVEHIRFNRNGGFEFENIGKIFNFDKQNEVWDIFLNPSVPIEIDMNFGASAVLLDLSELMVEDLDMDFGASDTEIIFAKFPTYAKIDMGASSIELKFPKDYQVRIEVDGGLISNELVGFEKVGDFYLTENFKYDKEYININIDGGASSLTSEFY